jgi:hypothetical protein
VYQASYQELQKTREGVLLTDRIVIPTWANRLYTCDGSVTNSGAHAALGLLGLDQTVMVVFPEDEQFQQQFLFAIAMHLQLQDDVFDISPMQLSDGVYTEPTALVPRLTTCDIKLSRLAGAAQQGAWEDVTFHFKQAPVCVSRIPDQGNIDAWFKRNLKLLRAAPRDAIVTMIPYRFPQAAPTQLPVPVPPIQQAVNLIRALMSSGQEPRREDAQGERERKPGDREELLKQVLSEGEAMRKALAQPQSPEQAQVSGQMLVGMKEQMQSNMALLQKWYKGDMATSVQVPQTTTYPVPPPPFYPQP